jgi:outer membrane protein, heavy metal efflux system
MRVPSVTEHTGEMPSSTLGRSAVTLALLLGAAWTPASLAAQAGPGLALAEVYARVEAGNPMLEASRAAARAIATREGSAGLPPDPQLQIGVMNASLPGLETDMPGAMAPAIQVMQMVPFPGKLGLAGEIARQGTAMAEAAAEETAWEMRAHAAMAFYEIWQADRQIAVMQETLGLLESLGHVAKAMYVSGEGRQSDVLRASVEVVRMQADVARMQAMRSAAASRLNALMDRPADTPVPVPVFSPLPLTLPAADTLEAWAEQTRPALARARIGVERAGTNQQLARRELWPDLTVGVQYGQRGSEMGTERMGSLMVGFNVPLFAGQRQLQMRYEAVAMEQMARADLAGVRAEVDARIAGLLAELDRARTLVGLYRTEVLPQAEANVSSSLSSYRTGAVDFMTLLDAQMTANDYRQELYVLLAEYGRMIAELERTVGRALPLSGATLTEER